MATIDTVYLVAALVPGNEDAAVWTGLAVAEFPLEIGQAVCASLLVLHLSGQIDFTGHSPMPGSLAASEANGPIAVAALSLTKV